MARYRLEVVGVMDIDNDERLTPGCAGWNAYEAWIAAGNVPDPMPEVSPSRAELIDYLWGAVKERRRACTEGGARVVINGEPKWFHSDVFSRTQWLGMMTLGQSLPAGKKWRTMDGSRVDLTPTVVQQVFAAIITKEGASFDRGEALRAELDAAPDPRTVILDADWPDSYNDPAPVPQEP